MKTKLSILIALFVTMSICNVNAQWQPTNGPYGHSGGIYSPSRVIMSIEKSGVNLFAGVLGGVMLSINNGDIWQKVLQVDSAFALKYNGINLYAGTESGFYLSINNGSTWTQSNTGLTNLSVLSFAVNGTSLFAGTRGGVFISTNNGTSWSPSNIGMPSTSVNALLIDGVNIFAGTNQGVYLSTNNGLTWSAMNSGMTGIPVINSFAINGVNIFVGTAIGHVYLTTNNGISWVDVSNGLIGCQGIFVSNIGTKIFVGCNGGIYYSVNNGGTWTTNNNSFGAETFLINGANLYTGSYSGLSVSIDNGNHWSHLGLGSANTVNALATNGTKIFAATNCGVYYTSDNGNTWERGAFQTSYWGALSFNAIAVNGSNVFASAPLANSGGQGNLFRSIDDGINWTRIISDTNSIDTIIMSLGMWSTKIFAGTVYKMYYSSDNGTTWSNYSNGFNATPFIVSIVPSGPVIFAGAGWLSTDGVNWTGANTLGGMVLASNGSNIYSSTSISNNYGSNWSPYNIIYQGASTTLVDIAVKEDTLIGVSGSAGSAFISTDNGITWSAINNGILDCYYKGSCIINGSNAFLATGQNWGYYPGGAGCDQQNNGVFRAGLVSLATGIKEAGENFTFSIYPNPAQSDLTIKTNRKLIGSTFFIYDIQGRIITKGKLANEISNISIDALAPGFYLFQIDGQKSQSLKFIKN